MSDRGNELVRKLITAKLQNKENVDNDSAPKISLELEKGCRQREWDFFSSLDIWTYCITYKALLVKFVLNCVKFIPEFHA